MLRDGAQRKAMLLAGGLLLLLLLGCTQSAAPDVVVQPGATRTAATAAVTASPVATPSPTLSPTASLTPSPTATPPPTPTPTPTAPPLTVSGDPLAGLAGLPVGSSGAPCGTVDLLDFPIDPPLAANVSRGGQDFGIFRSRYDKYHAGEDWSAAQGRSNFGSPVYVIGHGQVTYAQPLGWGRDKGVVIVRHFFSDGGSVLSFYGHLDPPSVVLAAGACVARGDLVGNIGRPRSSPHLHFEIRTHLPFTPGPGYWPEDPTTAGWLPPSQFIWENRLSAAPGVAWTLPPLAQDSRGLGELADGTLLLLTDGALQGRAPVDGALRWQLRGENAFLDALWDPAAGLVYAAGRGGMLGAYAIPAIDPLAQATPLWATSLGSAGTARLLPLPGGGVIAALGRRLIAFSPSGTSVWSGELENRPVAWTLRGDELLLATSSADVALWTVTAGGLFPWEAPGGEPLLLGDRFWLYAADGLYRLDADRRTATLFKPLAPALLLQKTAVSLADGGALLAHSDRADRRLIRLDSSGNVRWERSFLRALDGTPRLLASAGRVYLLADGSGTSAGLMTLYEVDLESGNLVSLFVGGTRSPARNETWLLTGAGGRLYLNIGGGHLVALDLAMARAAVAAP